MDVDYEQINVTMQEDDPESYLNLTRFLITTRQSQPALRYGDFEFVETGSDAASAAAVLAYARQYEGKIILCLYNLSHTKQTLPGDFLSTIQPVRDLLHPNDQFDSLVRVCHNEPNHLELLPYAAHWLTF